MYIAHVYTYVRRMSETWTCLLVSLRSQGAVLRTVATTAKSKVDSATVDRLRHENKDLPKRLAEETWTCLSSRVTSSLTSLGGTP